jgi:hypothetical protein
MAHIAQLGALTDELISLLASSSTKVNMFHSLPHIIQNFLSALVAIVLELTRNSLTLKNLTCTEKVPFGPFDTKTMLERTSSMSQIVSMV